MNAPVVTQRPWSGFALVGFAYVIAHVERLKIPAVPYIVVLLLAVVVQLLLLAIAIQLQ
jgi:hypothetical protein